MQSEVSTIGASLRTEERKREKKKKEREADGKQNSDKHAKAEQELGK